MPIDEMKQRIAELMRDQSAQPTRDDVDALIAEVVRLEGENTELKVVIIAIGARVTLDQAREALQRVRLGPTR